MDQWQLNTDSQNKIFRAGVLSALNWNSTFDAVSNFTTDYTRTPPKGPFQTNDHTYTLANNNFGTLQIPQQVFRSFKPNAPDQNGLVYAFGNDNGNGIYYSGQNFWGSYGTHWPLPYFTHEKRTPPYEIGIKYPTINVNGGPDWNDVIKNKIKLGKNSIRYVFNPVG